MLRSTGLRVGVALAFSMACACVLLEPYPGGGDPGDALAKGQAGPPGMAQDPLVDPPEDPSVMVLNAINCPADPDKGCVLALPGTGFPVHLTFNAPAANVIGGGISVEGSNEVQWTLLGDVSGQTAGDIQFSYLLPDDVCDGIPNLCHVIETKQFAVTSDLKVSKPVVVKVVLQCASCDSASCQQALPANACQECVQPDTCKMLGDVCFAPGKPGENTDAETIYDAFLDEDGALWSSEMGCAQGEPICQKALDNFNMTMQCTF